MSIQLSKKACEIIEDVREPGTTPSACKTWEERPKGNQYVRKMRFRYAGDYMRGHLHHFDHNTIVFTGSIRVIAIKPNGEEIDAIFEAPKPGRFSDQNEGWVLIQADTHHEIIALEDFTEAWCCFTHRGPHGEIVDKYDGNDAPYSSKRDM